MGVVIVLLVVLLAVGGAVAVALARKSRRTSDRAGTGANEILQAPPTSFPSDVPGTLNPSITPVPPGTALPPGTPAWSSQLVPATEAATPATVEPVGGLAPVDWVEPVEPVEPVEVVDRFRPPGSRVVAPTLGASTPVVPRYPLEPATPAVEPPAPTVAEQATAEVLAEPELEPEAAPASPAEPEPALAETSTPEAAPEPQTQTEPEPVAAMAAAPLSLVDDRDHIIDLDREHATDEQERAWQEVVLEPEPDSVDHVLQALINRARFKQVGVEEVATELVERADLRGEAVSDVLAELVGRADDQIIDPDRSSELVLFNDAVPSRPGQLTDFARLKPADKKRIIIRVLCLLVARSEDQQLPPRAAGESPTTSWPLARAAWPAGAGDDDAEVTLPSRLAKSG